MCLHILCTYQPDWCILLNQACWIQTGPSCHAAVTIRPVLSLCCFVCHHSEQLCLLLRHCRQRSPGCWQAQADETQPNEGSRKALVAYFIYWSSRTICMCARSSSALPAAHIHLPIYSASPPSEVVHMDSTFVLLADTAVGLVYAHTVQCSVTWPGLIRRRSLSIPLTWIERMRAAFNPAAGGTPPQVLWHTALVATLHGCRVGTKRTLTKVWQAG